MNNLYLVLSSKLTKTSIKYCLLLLTYFYKYIDTVHINKLLHVVFIKLHALEDTYKFVILTADAQVALTSCTFSTSCLLLQLLLLTLLLCT